MKALQKILTEITQLTNKIETKYPELYRSLDENPITLPVSKSPHIDKMVMVEYLESLKLLLNHYIEEEKVKKQ